MPRKVKETGLFNMGFGSPVLPRRRRTRISPPPPPPGERKKRTWENIPGERRKPHTQAQLEALERLTQEEIEAAIRESSIRESARPLIRVPAPRKPGAITPEAKEPRQIPKRRQMKPEAKEPRQMPKRRQSRSPWAGYFGKGL